MTDWLECPNCSEDQFQADAEGLFYEGDAEACKHCGQINWVSISEHGDEDAAYVNSEEHVEDVGQPRCDGSCYCGTAPTGDYAGEGCHWNCPRAAGFFEDYP